jgi:hypothetical protein
MDLGAWRRRRTKRMHDGTDAVRMRTRMTRMRMRKRKKKRKERGGRCEASWRFCSSSASGTACWGGGTSREQGAWLHTKNACAIMIESLTPRVYPSWCPPLRRRIRPPPGAASAEEAAVAAFASPGAPETAEGTTPMASLDDRAAKERNISRILEGISSPSSAPLQQ